MMSLVQDRLRNEIWQAASDGDSERLRDLATDLDWGSGAHIPDDTIDVFADALLDADFVRSNAAHVIAEVFEQWGINVGARVDRLTSAQQSKLMHAFEVGWPIAADQLSFELCVIPGERLHDAPSLEVLRNVSTSPHPYVRRHVAHALQHFLWGTEDEESK